MFRPELIICVELLSRIATANQAWTEAARLHGAARRRRDQTGINFQLPGLAEGQAAAAAAHDAIGAGPFASAMTEGGSFDFDAMVVYVQRARGERKRPALGWESLSPMEIQMIALVVEGLTNPQIAQRQLVARDTVKTHLSHVFTKLGVRSRGELAAIAAQRDLSIGP
jgi:DNA-binding CsgD family transcriptional regulator